MKIKRLLTWQFLVGFIMFFVGLIIGSILSLFFYIKNVDVFAVRERQEYLIQEVEELNKEREDIVYILREKGLIQDWNEKALIIEPEEEGK